MLKGPFKIFLFALAGFILLLILAGGFTQTRRFKAWLRDELVQQAAALLNGKLRLGRIDGNLISKFGFYDLCIELESDTLLYVSKIEAGLSPLELFDRKVLVTNMTFHAPVLLVKQRSDSTWNVAHLLKPSSNQQTANLWRVALQSLQINDGAVTLAPLDTAQKLLPRRIQNISTNMRLDYAAPRLNVMLRHLRLTSLNPPLQLDSLAAQIFWGEDSLQLKNLKLRSRSSRLAGQITLRHLTRPIYEIKLIGAPLHTDDVRAFFPHSPVSGPVHGALHALGDAQSVRAQFQLAHADGSANGNFFVFFDSTTTHYDIEAAIRALNLDPYLRRAPGPTRLNFDLKLDGTGLTLDDLTANLALHLDSLRVLGREVSQLRLTANMHDKQINAKFSALSPFGELEISSKLVDPQREQRFEFNAEARHLNLARLLRNDTLDSDVSFRVAGSGKHFDATRRKFDGWLQISPSRLPSVLIDYAYCQFHAHGEDLQLDTLHVASSIGNVNAAGVLSLRYANNFRFRAELGDLTWVKRAVEADTLRAGGVFSGSATGPLDSLAVFSRFDLRKVKYNTTFIDQLRGTATFRRAGDNGGGFVQARGDRLMFGFVPIDSAKASVYYDLTRAQIAANFWRGEKNAGELEGRYTFGEIARFDVIRAEIDIFGQTWRAPQDQPMWVDIGDEDYDFYHCVLASGNQRLFLDGRLSYVGAENLQFKIEGVDLATMAALMRNGNASAKNSVAGILAGQGVLTGTADAPLLRGNLVWKNGRVADFAFEKWEADLGYDKELLSWKFKLDQNQDRFLTGDGYLPMNLSLNNTGRVLFDDRPMRIQASTTGIDLAFLQTLTNRVKQVRGTLIFDVKLENTLKQPHSKGAVSILDGAFSVTDYGANYSDVQLKLSIDTAAVKLIDLRIQSDKGELSIGGLVKRTQSEITNAEARLTAKDFLVARNRNMELRLNADIAGSGDAQGPRYSGNITVERSRFFLPALQQRSVIQLNEPKANAAATDSAANAAAGSEEESATSRWLEKLRGELKINIPRNTWLRGPELNAEISGALDFIQEGTSKFSLFGTLDIIRGTYELYGKKFDIDNGKINFEGDVQSPQFELAAKHVFRAATGDREKKNLEVKISGDLNNPKVEFLADGETLDGKDALANLIFGVDFNELLPGQREGLESEADKEGSVFSAAARGLVSGLVSQELAKSLGRTLNVDLIEIQSGEDITKSSLLVGKYLTDNLFISFGQEPEGRVVALEWELLKFLFLQAAHGGEENRKTGFDLIWKLDW
jgi:translocation and assembly module TamB